MQIRSLLLCVNVAQAYAALRLPTARARVRALSQRAHASRAGTNARLPPTSARAATARRDASPLPADVRGGADASLGLDASPLLPAAVGAATACLGIAYAACLKRSIAIIWRRPGGPWFVPAITAAGGAAVGAAARGGVHGVGAFVEAARGAAPWPAASAALPPLLLASLAGTACGFSVGPEAPMVAAGGLVGACVQSNFQTRRGDASRACVLERSTDSVGSGRLRRGGDVRLQRGACVPEHSRPARPGGR